MEMFSSLPPGWRKHESKREGGRPYYFHGPTKKSQWHLPVASAAASGAAAPAVAAPSRKRPRPASSAASAARPAPAIVATYAAPAIDPSDPMASLRKTVRVQLAALIAAAQSTTTTSGAAPVAAAEELPPPCTFSDLDRQQRYVVQEEADEFSLVAIENQDHVTREKTITVYHPSHDIPDETSGLDKMSRTAQSHAAAAGAAVAAAKRRKVQAAREAAEAEALRSAATGLKVTSLNVDKRDRRLVQDIEEELATKKQASCTT